MRRPRGAASGRRGYSLIEMVLVIGSVTTILAVVAGFLNALLKMDRAGRTSLTETGAAVRLGRQFRNDVRAAAEARPVRGDSKEATGLTLSATGGPEVRYRAEGDRLVREESAGGKVVRRESYSLGPLGHPAFDTGGGEVRLELRRPPPPSTEAGSPRPGVRFAATLGKDRAPVGREREGGPR